MTHTPETKRLAILRQHLIAWDDALAAAKLSLFLAEQTLPIDQQRLPRLLSFYAIVAYARPFIRGDGLEKPDHKGNLQLITLRNEISEHTDVDDHAYLTNVKILNHKVVNEVPITVLLPYMQSVIDEASKERELVVKEIIKLEGDINALNLADGIYE